MTGLSHADVIAYKPESLFRRDGYAIVRVEYATGNLTAKDTFDVNDTELTAAELATATVRFNLDDFQEERYAREEDYAPADIHVLPTRKGMEKRKFVRRGATELTESQAARRSAALEHERMMRARAALLSPLADQAFAAAPLPSLTIEESGELTDVIHWCQRASRQFKQTLTYLMGVQNGKGGDLHFTTVHADEDHYELVRARRAFHAQLTALRALAAEHATSRRTP